MTCRRLYHPDDECFHQEQPQRIRRKRSRHGMKLVTAILLVILPLSMADVSFMMEGRKHEDGNLKLSVEELQPQHRRLSEERLQLQKPLQRRSLFTDYSPYNEENNEEERELKRQRRKRQRQRRGPPPKKPAKSATTEAQPDAGKSSKSGKSMDVGSTFALAGGTLEKIDNGGDEGDGTGGTVSVGGWPDSNPPPNLVSGEKPKNDIAVGEEVTLETPDTSTPAPQNTQNYNTQEEDIETDNDGSSYTSAKPVSGVIQFGAGNIKSTTNQTPQGPTPRISNQYGCIPPTGSNTLDCPSTDLAPVCDKYNNALKPDGTRVAMFEDCYQLCKPSFCCIHDSRSLEYSPTCREEPNCPLYFPCYIIWWKLHDTIGPANFLRVAQREPFYETVDFNYILTDLNLDEDFFRQLFGHHFDAEIDGFGNEPSNEMLENRTNW